ncbi:MAG: PVC-type heme-binding CxxCH protein, partial [Opitutus sp.]
QHHWRVSDGAITGEIPAGAQLADSQFIFWDGDVHDFELELEFRLTGDPSANSGIQYRAQQSADGHAAGYQADLDDGARWLGRIYDEHGRELLVERGTRVSISPDGRRWTDEFAPAASFQPLFKRGEWNSYRITARASHVELWVNGTLCAALDDHQDGAAEFSGKLAFQLHSGKGPAKIQFRNIRLAQLGQTTPPPPLDRSQVTALQPLQSLTPQSADGTRLNLNLETANLTGWTAEGTAWSGQPVRYAEPSTPRRKNDLPTDPVGNYWIGPAKKPGPAGTGRLTSAPFEVTHRWASYLVGGGGDINQTRVELVDAVSGAILHSSSGANSDTLRREIVDFSSSIGRRIFIRLVDQATEGLFGHIDFDDFVFHDRQPDFAAADPDSLRQLESGVLWHLRPNPAAPTQVANLDAQKLVRDIKVQPGFQVELIAAEPDIHQPIAFAIDERGRLWVVEAYSYPTRQPAGQGKDRVVIFEDKDGDGSFETRTVFIEGLNLVSAIEVGFGGVWIGAAPELLFIPDRNHDDRPDGAPEVLLDGWGFQDTHETLNSFTWGPDGWLYGDQGVFNQSRIGKPGTPADQRTLMRAGVWRYHPVRREFEVFATGGSNQWGIDFNDVGHLFITHCRSFNGGGGTTHVIRNGQFWNQANSDYAPYVSIHAPDFAPALKNYLPSSARYDSGEGGAGKPGSTAVYGGHSHVGTMIYQGDNWPEIYRDHLFTINLHGHQLNHQHNVRQGSGYETFHAGYDLFFVPDRTFVGVDIQSGPDGAAYIIDWCDHQHCHSPRDDIWERNNGRIYRLAWGETWKPAHVDLGVKTDDELATLHTHHNEWYVRTARRLLQQRATERPLSPTAITTLRTMMTTPNDVSLSLRGLWTLHAVGLLGNEDLAALARHSSDVVRSWAIQLATENKYSIKLPIKTLIDLATRDPSATVRLALASAVPTLSSADRWAVTTALAAHGEDAADRFLPKMIWFGLAPLIEADYRRALALAASTPLPSLADSIYWYAAQTSGGRDALIQNLANSAADRVARVVRIMAFALETESGLPMPQGWPAVAQLAAQKNSAASSAEATAQLSALFGDATVLAEARATLAASDATLVARQTALKLLQRANDRSSLPLYARLIDDDAFRSAVIPLLAGSDDPTVATSIMRRFPQLSDADRAVALATLTSHPVLGTALLEAVKLGAFNKSNLTALHVRQLRNLNNEHVDSLLDAMWGKTSESSADLKSTIARYKKTYAEAPRWAFNSAAGRETFQQLCATCHTYDGQGGKLGPDLTGSWRNALDYFIENIVDPNAVVGADYQLNVIKKRDGSVIPGMVERETATALVVRTATETVNVPKDQVVDREVLPQSLMPGGLLQALPDRQVIELLMFLTDRG